MDGWISLHRKLLENPIFDNPDLLKLWIWCLLKATHKPIEQMVGLKVIPLKEGQFVTGRFKGATELKMNPNTFYKHLKRLESMHMISLNSNNKMTVVTIEKWTKYQIEKQQHNNKITTKEQQNNTNNNNNNIIIKDIVEHLNKKSNKNYQPSSKKTISLINARLEEGFTLEDFKKVIDSKVASWSGTDMDKYIRPATLFNADKFEGYLNEAPTKQEDPLKGEYFL